MKLYKPNKSVKGSALSINFSAKTDKEGIKGDKSFYFQLVSQTGWDDKSGNGTFKDGKKIIVKFAPHEISGIIAAIRKNISLADTMNVKYVYHNNDATATNITFEPHFKSEKQGENWVKTNVQNGFIFRVTKTDKNNEQNKDTISIGFTWAEVELLRAVLENGLVHISDSWYSENINRGSKNKEKLKQASKVEEQPVKESEPISEEADF